MNRKRTRHQKPSKSLQKLREIIGLSQRQLAQQTGISEPAIKKIEHGDKPLSPEFAHRIYSATGASEKSLIKGNGKLAYILAKNGYSIGNYQQWRDFQHDSFKPWETFEETICPHMILLLLAAVNPPMGGKVKNRFIGLLESWAAWEAQAIKAFDLLPQIKGILAGSPIKSTAKMTWGEWRNIIKNQNALIDKFEKQHPRKKHGMRRDWHQAHWNFYEDDPSKKDDEILVLETVGHWGFHPGILSMPGLVKLLKDQQQSGGL